MAYNKRNWKARQGTGLNFFSIDGATPVPIVNQPTTLTEAGDALSAGNLNDWEQRIADGFDSASGELADAVEELESEDTALRSAINANSNRIANLEQKAGDYSIVQYRGTNAVPTGKAKYGLVKSIVGKSRSMNQLSYNGNFSDGTSYWAGRDGDFISVSDGVLTLTASSGTLKGLSSDDNYYHVIAGHKYMVSGEIKSSISGVASFAFSSFSGTHSISANQWSNVSRIIDQASTEDISIYFLIQGSFSGGETIQYKNIIVRDLTLIFPEGVPSTIAECVQKCPDILKWDAFNAGSLVDTVVSGVKSVGVNIWDEEWESGYWDGSGQKVSNASYGRSANYIRVTPSTAYYFKFPTSFVSGQIFVTMFDIDKNIIRYISTSNGSQTMDSNCYYITLWAEGWTSNSYEVQVCLNSYTDKTTYHPYKTDTLSLPETVTLRSAGSVSDELDVESGVIKRKVGSYTFTGNETWGINFGAFYSFNLADKAYGLGNFIVQGAVVHAVSIWDYLNEGEFVGNTSSSLITCKSSAGMTSAQFASYMAGKTILYELATPTTESIDPVPDNTLYTEGGGTIDTIQDQTPVIDNCLDVGYLAV